MKCERCEVVKHERGEEYCAKEERGRNILKHLLVTTINPEQQLLLHKIIAKRALDATTD